MGNRTLHEESRSVQAEIRPRRLQLRPGGTQLPYILRGEFFTKLLEV